MLKKMEPIIREIWGILLVYGVLVQLVGIWFVQDKIRYTSGLWIGVALAGFMIWHMHRGISRALDMDPDGAKKQALKMYSIRILIVCIAVLVLLYLKIGNIIMIFIGMLGLKPAAYIQPVLHDYLMKRAGKGR